MDRRAALRLGVTGGVLGAVASSGTAVAGPRDRELSDEALVRSLPGEFRNGYAHVNGTRLHYVTGGRGTPLVLLPGWPHTWWEFHKVMPALAARHQVIAVDIRGMGGSDKPAAGYDKKTMAADVHQLVRHLGHHRVDIAGADIGAMVAFSFAANHPEAIRRLALLDVAHPDENLYELTLLPQPGQPPVNLWWFAFNLVPHLPEQLLAGRSRYLVDYLCGLLLKDQSAMDDHTRAVYARAYSRPDAIRAGNRWYQAFAQDIADVRTYPKVTTPILAIASDGNPSLADSLPATATDFRLVEMPESGHYLTEEQPELVTRHLVEFFG